MLSRIKFEIDPLVKEILDQLPIEVWTSTTTTFFDPAIGGGQFVRAIELRLRAAGHSTANIKKRVFGMEVSNLHIRYAVNKYKLVGTYSAGDFLLKDFGKMKFDVALGNPPYTDGSGGEANLYQKIVSAAALSEVAVQAWVLPNSWFLSNTKEHKTFRNFIYNAGLKSITIHPMNIFENAKVKTSTIICERGYTGDIAVVTPNGGYTIPANKRGEPILPVSSSITHSLLTRIAPSKPYAFEAGKNPASPRKAVSDKNFSKTKTAKYKYPIITKLAKDSDNMAYVFSSKNEDPDSNKWRVAIPYLATGYASGDMQFGAVAVVPNDGTQLCKYYRYLIVNSKEQAETLQQYFMSKFVRVILHYTRTSRTLDNPQLKFIPLFNAINTKLNDQDIYDHFNLSAAEIDAIKNCECKWIS